MEKHRFHWVDRSPSKEERNHQVDASSEVEIRLERSLLLDLNDASTSDDGVMSEQHCNVVRIC